MGFFGVFELGSLICALGTSSKMFIVGRAIAGIGTSGIINGAFTIIAGCVPMEKRPSKFPCECYRCKRLTDSKVCLALSWEVSTSLSRHIYDRADTDVL